MKKAYIPVSSDFISQKEINELILENSNYLDKLGCIQISSQQMNDAQGLFYFIVTGGTEKQILDLHSKRSKMYDDEEIVLLAHASRNSLPAALEVLARFQQDGKKGNILYLPEIDYIEISTSKPAIEKFYSDNILGGKKIGLIGKPSDWLVASSPDRNLVKSTFGVEVIPIYLKELEEHYKNIALDGIKDIVSDFLGKSSAVIEPSSQEIEDSVRIYVALRKLISQYKLDALTIRCFDLVVDLKTTGCFALSRLNDEGIIAGCEGDLVSTIGMMWAQQNFNKLPWMANPSQIDVKENSVVLAHCTVPSSLVQDYSIRSHFESGIGVGIQGEFPLKDVILFRLGGKKLDLIWKAEGRIVRTECSDDLCRTQIKVFLNEQYSVQDLLTHPLGNHLIVVHQ